MGRGAENGPKVLLGDLRGGSQRRDPDSAENISLGAARWLRIGWKNVSVEHKEPVNKQQR